MTERLDFWSAAEADPSRVALVDAFERRLEAGELLAAANRLVRGLRARGLQPGDAVAAVLPTSAEALEIYLAATQAGW
jgi:long-chain acyl-CoA synthetase